MSVVLGCHWWLPLVTLLVPLVLGALNINPSDLVGPKVYINPNNTRIQCIECPPGTYVSRHCTENGTISLCKSCPNGTFSRSYGQALSCQNCLSVCPIRDAFRTGVCNSTTDWTCMCNTGFYFKYRGQNQGDCLRHTKCPVGQGVISKGTPYNNTQCGGCRSGTFSDQESSTEPCKPHKNCTGGEVPIDDPTTKDVTCRQQGERTDGLNGGEVAGIVIGVVLSVTIALLLLYFLWWKRRKPKLPDESELNSRRNDVSTQPNGTTSGNYTPVQTVDFLDPQPVLSDVQPAPVPSSDTNTEVPHRPKISWPEVCRFLSKELIVKDYKSILRTIMVLSGYTDGDRLIIEHQENYPRDMQEVIYQVLFDWTKKARSCTPGVSLHGIIKALEAERMMESAQKVAEKFEEHIAMENDLA